MPLKIALFNLVIKINPFGFSRAKFDAPKLGRAKFDRFRTLGAKILNLIAHAADGFAPRRRTTTHKFYLAARKFHGAYFALKFWRRFAADTGRSINF